MGRHASGQTSSAICIVSHNAFGALTGGRTGHIGGVEWQTSLTARWLASRGHAVSLVIWDEGQGDEVTIDGVRVIRMCREDAGLRGLRFFVPRWTSLLRALRRADADVYYHNCGEYVTGQVALWCRRHGRRFVYSVASDPDCDASLPEMTSRRERTLYRYGLRHADRVIVQTRRQQAMLRDGWSLASTVIPMPCPGPDDDEYIAPAPPESGSARVVWVGRLSRVKRLEMLLDMAEALPEVAFDVVGGPDAPPDYVDCLRQRAARLPNVILHGRLARDRMPEIYRGAACLCCTSAYEGFPNTFLEAWSYGVPVISTVDPDGLIAERRLGCVAADAPAMARALRALLGEPELWCRVSGNARRYYAENHRPETVMPRFEQVLLGDDILMPALRADAPEVDTRP